MTDVKNIEKYQFIYLINNIKYYSDAIKIANILIP